MKEEEANESDEEMVESLPRPKKFLSFLKPEPTTVILPAEVEVDSSVI